MKIGAASLLSADASEVRTVTNKKSVARNRDLLNKLCIILCSVGFFDAFSALPQCDARRVFGQETIGFGATIRDFGSR